jgi:hypothetical protein
MSPKKRERGADVEEDVDVDVANDGTGVGTGVAAATKRKRVTFKPIEYKLSNGTIMRLDGNKSSSQYACYEMTVKSLDDLLALDAFYVAGNVDKRKISNIPFAIMHRIADPIRELDELVGMKDVKTQLLSIILYFIQFGKPERASVTVAAPTAPAAVAEAMDREMCTCEGDVNVDGDVNDFAALVAPVGPVMPLAAKAKDSRDMLHTVVYGGPGVGKTRFINILARIYAALGILPTSKVTVAKRSDLIAGYLGQTAIKTRKMIEAAKGGILLIDEAYSLGDVAQKDSFSRECIDTLNQALSEEKADFICIIAGYKADLEDRFFKSNPGLERRFPFRISIGEYTATHLRDIFVQIVRSRGWDIDASAAPISLFEDNRDHFRFNGGDMETLFTKTKFLHGRRVFGKRAAVKKMLTHEDVAAGIDAFLDNDQVKARKELRDLVSMMYV